MAVARNHLIILCLIILIGIFFRFYHLSSNPPGLYWDETVFGYDAYSVFKTGRDHHGRFSPIFFESFGDWKLPVYHYLLVPSIAVFGLNEFAVRFPSAFLGSLSIILIYLLSKRLTNNNKVGLWSALFLAISPWHIQFSRGGFESTAGLFFLLSGSYLFLRSVEKPAIIKILSSFIFFGLSIYSYHAYRIFTPLLVISLIFIFHKKLKKFISKLIVPAVIIIFLLLPIIVFSFSSQGRSRAISQSVFKDDQLEQTRLDFDQKSKKPLRFLSGYIFNKPLFYSYQAFKGYFDSFSPVFLFFRGDQIGRHSQVDMGQIYAFELILIIFGLYSLRFVPKEMRVIIITWLLISPIPSSIVTPTPHAYRTLQLIIPLAILSGLGANRLFTSNNILIRLLVPAAIVFSTLSFSHLLFVHYPKKFAADWQDGYKEMVNQIKKYQNDYEKIYVTNINQVPYIYLLFYLKYDPQKFISENGSRESFDKYFFISDEADISNQGRLLYVAPSWKKVDGKWLAAVNDNSSRHIYSLWEVGNKN